MIALIIRIIQLAEIVPVLTKCAKSLTEVLESIPCLGNIV